MIESGSVENNKFGSLLKSTEGETPECRSLTQEAVNEQIKKFIAPKPSLLEDLNLLN